MHRLPVVACLLVVGLLTSVITPWGSVTPVAARAVPNIQLTINGQTSGPMLLTPGVPFDYTVTGLPIDGQNGITVGTSALALAADTGNGSYTPVTTLVNLDRSVATASGQSSIPTDFPYYVGQIPLALVLTVAYAGSDEIVVQVLSNIIPITVPFPEVDLSNLSLSVSGSTSETVFLTADLPFSYGISGIPSLDTGIGIGLVTSFLVVTTDPDQVTAEFTTFYGGGGISDPAVFYPIVISAQNGTGQATIPALYPANVTEQAYLVVLTAAIFLGPGNTPVVQTGISNVVAVSFVPNTAPTLTGLSSPLTTIEDEPVEADFVVGDTVTPPGNLTVTATEPGKGSVTFDGATADRTLTYTPDPNATGTDTFDVTVSDGALSATVTVSVTIEPVNDAPVIDEQTVPEDITVEATGPSGAAVTFTPPTATDPDVGDVVTVTCVPASGATFPVGETDVLCTASDGEAEDTATFTVTVEDTTAPILTVPANVTAEATSPGGATVAYTATATDLVDGSVTPVCSLASGSLFPIGTTTVNCTATDAAGNVSATQTFTVTVRDATGPVITWVGGPQPNQTYTQSNLPAAPTCTGADTSSAVTQCRVYGYSTAVGTHTLTARARDAEGNSTISTRTYTVTASAPTATPRPVTATPRPVTATPRPATTTPRPTSVAPTATPTRPVRPTATTAPVQPTATVVPAQPTATPVTPVVPPTSAPTRPPRG